MRDSSEHSEVSTEGKGRENVSKKSRDRTSTTADSQPTRSPEQSRLWFIPKTTVGKVLLSLYLVAFGAVSLSVLGVAFSEPRLIGPVPEVVAWTYGWFGMMNVVLLGTYVYLFKPWAETVTDYVDYEEPEPPVGPGVTDKPPEDSPVKAGEPK